jgi:hypothetical protein
MQQGTVSQQSQVTVILRHERKQVLSSLVLSSFASQLSRMEGVTEGNTMSKLESSKENHNVYVHP